MRTSRLEAFSDGVLAIIITIMVLELKVPKGDRLHDLVSITGPGLLSYLLSFVYVGIYWNNHHHMFHVVRRVSGGVLWANLTLLVPDRQRRRTDTGRRRRGDSPGLLCRRGRHMDRPRPPHRPPRQRVRAGLSRCSRWPRGSVPAAAQTLWATSGSVDARLAA